MRVCARVGVRESVGVHVGVGERVGECNGCR